MRYSVYQLFDLLNQQDECPWIEAKGGSTCSHSVMETVCAYCNEPGLGGGYILMGIAGDETALFPQYRISGVTDPDKLQRDFATQCAGMFNIPVRPEVSVENVSGKTVIRIWVNELPQRQKPLFFKSDGLPNGALRRIGSTDQHCTEDDMHVFYRDATSFDQTPVKGSSLNDIDENAIKRYRFLREKVNPVAEELSYDDAELLQSLGCVNKENPNELNMAGLLIFGSNKIQRSTYPMLRVDYIRVPGNTWVSNPDDRFTTIDMRGPLILMLYRLIDAINADLPKGFLLSDDIQATSVGLPLKALREAIVNALMHRSYREHRPTQVIRYDNRIEIINPGFSIKSEDKLGLPGSETRNPFIAAVFHDTNLAETKGSGIRAMRRLMEQAHLVLPTFESSREYNEFTVRLLLHHFLNEEDVNWLSNFDYLGLNDAQKQALIFVREAGAIDNQTYRQMADCDILKASAELRTLKNAELVDSKGRGKATYYIPGLKLIPLPKSNDIHGKELNIQPAGVNTHGDTLNTHGDTLNTHGDSSEIQTLILELPAELKTRIMQLRKREQKIESLQPVILEVCAIRPMKAEELATIFQKRVDYFRKKYLFPLLEQKKIRYLYPEMIKHPDQAYLTIK